MCGLIGIVQTGGEPFRKEVLRRMADVINHRGPDDEGYFIDGPVALCHKRLSIIDLVSGHQPMTVDGLTIVFNGEIYNYIELREELIRRGHTFETTSDTEVILRLYMEHGAECLPYLNGMFAFLIYDRRQRILFAARDHFGIKPLYFHATDRRIIFASEIKALLQHPNVSAEPDYDAMRDYLTFQFVPNEKTLFRGIFKLLPGHFKVIDLADLKSRSACYWEPHFAVDLDHTEKYFLEELRRLLEDSARIQMRSDVPVGTYLSGGLDSSIVSVLASRIAPGTLKTFTGAFNEGPEFDETGYAKEVAAACNAQSFVIRPTEADFEELLPRLVWHMDEPAAGPGLFPQYMVSRLARSEVKVCLGGQGGDEVFGGYARYVIAYLEQALKGAIYETTDEGEHIVSLESILPNLPHLKQYAPMLRGFWGDGLFETMEERYFRLIDRSGGAEETFSDDFNNAFDREAVFSRFKSVFNHPDTKSYYNKMTHFDMVSSLPALLHVEDRVSMAHSLESRVPLLDYRIVDLVTSMPPCLKFKGAEMKYALKRVVGDLVPPRILARKDKMGFPVPMHLWARGRAREFFQSVLLSNASRSRGLYNTDAVEKLLDNEAAFGRRLWGLLNLELWHCQFIDTNYTKEKIQGGEYATYL